MTLRPDTPVPELPSLPAASRAPEFEVRLQPPDLSPWRAGNTGLPGIIQLESGRPGPHVAVTALMHGNEIAGAIVVDELLRDGFRPRLGRLSLGFLNLAAFDRFDPARPTASRFVDEDMNRLWDADILDSGRSSVELDRARVLLPLIESVDRLLDLHSMLWPSDALILGGPIEKGRRFAVSIGTPPLVVADRGHSSGPRLIDYRPFVDVDDPRAACLVEAGPHWQPGTVDTARDTVHALLRGVGMMQQTDQPPRPAVRCATVTHVVTASTGSFGFVRRFHGGEVIAQGGTVIAHDGATKIRTPYDDCLLVMPSLQASRGHTAVRLARLLPDES